MNSEIASRDASARLKILYIVGAGRSGSTLLARILGSLRNYSFPGEPYYLWEEGLIEDRQCECGKRFSCCPYWSRVMERVGSRFRIVPAEQERMRLRVNRTRNLPSLIIHPVRDRLLASVPSYRKALLALYRAMADQAGASVIVDGSKLPSHAIILRTFPEIDLYVVHLVRDPRGVVNSWGRKKHNPATGADLGRMGTLKCCALWAAWNLAAELCLERPGRYLRLRYEDWVAEPHASVKRIMRFLGEDRVVESLSGNLFKVRKSHTLGGNPDRFDASEIRIREDSGWLEELSAGRQRVVGLLLWPFMWRYGYLTRRPSQ